MTNILKIALMMQGGQGWLGGLEYIKNLILALGSLPDEVRSTFEVHLISGPLDDELYHQLAPYLKQFYRDDVDFPPFTFFNRVRLRLDSNFRKKSNLRLERLLKQQGFDFIYPYVKDNTEITHYRSAAWIPDFQHKYLPQFFTVQELTERDQSFAVSAKYADNVVLSSQTAVEDFKKFFPDAVDKARVLSFKTSPSPAWYDGNPQQVQQSYCLPDRFLLVSNQFWQHKNHSLVFEALKLLKSRDVTPAVVFTGHIYDYRKPDYSDALLKSIHQLGIAHQVYLLGLIPKIDQIQLMRRSLAVIQPSLFEGWSTVVEDARSLGKAIILSDLPVHLEQDPPHRVFFDRTSAIHLAQKIEEFWLRQPPGPNFQAEQQARESSYTQIKDYGYRFLEIARGV
jgi:glycosyltransferase involved in cell wall biosynthesis